MTDVRSNTCPRCWAASSSSSVCATVFSLNPFSMIDAALIDSDEDYLVDALAMLKSIIGQMARHVDHLSDTERGLIDNAVGQAWHAKGREGSIDDVIEVLVAHGSLAAEDLATAMFPFSSKGTYGRFFIGEATVDMLVRLHRLRALRPVEQGRRCARWF